VRRCAAWKRRLHHHHHDVRQRTPRNKTVFPVFSRRWRFRHPGKCRAPPTCLMISRSLDIPALLPWSPGKPAGLPVRRAFCRRPARCRLLPATSTRAYSPISKQARFTITSPGSRIECPHLQARRNPDGTRKDGRPDWPARRTSVLLSHGLSVFLNRAALRPDWSRCWNSIPPRTCWRSGLAALRLRRSRNTVRASANSTFQPTTEPDAGPTAWCCFRSAVKQICHPPRAYHATFIGAGRRFPMSVSSGWHLPSVPSGVA